MKRWLFFFSLLSLPLFGEVWDTQLQEAKLYLETGNSSKAEKIYRALQQETLMPWGLAVVTYNLGYALFVQGDLEEAIITWESIEIPLSKEGECFSSPWSYLEPALKRNLLVAKWKRAQSYEGELLTKLRLYEEVRRNIAEWEKSLCIEFSQELLALKKAVSVKVSELLLTLYASLHEMTHPLGELFFLERGLDRVLSYSPFLEINSLYHQLFVEEVSQWQQLFAKSDQEVLREGFEKGVEAFRQGAFDRAKENWTEVQEELQQLFPKLFEEQPSKQMLQALLRSYETLFLLRPIDKRDIEQLNTLMKQLLLFYHEKLSLDISHKERYLVERALDHLQRNIRTLITHFSLLNPLDQQLFLEEGIDLLSSILEQLEQPASLLNLLKWGIEAQQSMLQLTRAEHSFSHPEALRELLVRSEEQVLATVSPFILSSLKLQHLLYQREKQCQRLPWDRVIPLFDQGQTRAQQVITLLNSSFEEAPKLIAFQEEVIAKWKEALRLLQEEREDEEETTELRSLMQLIQEMESIDRTPAPAKLQPIPGERPW